MGACHHRPANLHRFGTGEALREALVTNDEAGRTIKHRQAALITKSHF
jgi:hypothetical protein